MAKKNFEEALHTLEKIVDELEENEDLSLDKALKKFEEGMELVQFCTKTLEETQKKIDALNISLDYDEEDADEETDDDDYA